VKAWIPTGGANALSLVLCIGACALFAIGTYLLLRK
jgi:hypothetical protein